MSMNGKVTAVNTAPMPAPARAGDGGSRTPGLKFHPIWGDDAAVSRCPSGLTPNENKNRDQ